jgi:hypothetical protein
MTILRSFSLVLFLLLLGNTVIFAQDTGSIKGKVRDIENGRTIAGANITVRLDGKN